MSPSFEDVKTRPDPSGLDTAPHPVAINELAYRRPDVVVDETNSVPIVLADGGTWHFPKLFIKVRPSFKGGEPTGRRLVSGWSPDFDELLAENQAIALGQQEGDYLISCLDIASFLLSAYYALPDDVLEEILTLPEGDEAGVNWLPEVMDVARGRRRPKGPGSPGDATA